MANKLTPSKMRSLYAAIGRFTLTWADVETYLDVLVLKLRQPTERRLPHQLAEKIKFVRTAIQAERAAPYAKDARSLIDEIEALAETRHNYIHGSRIGHSVERSVLSVTLGRLLQPPKKARGKPVYVTAAEIEKTTDHLYELGGKMLDLLDQIV